MPADTGHSAAAASGRGTTLRDYLRVLRRRKWIILQAVIIVPLVAVGLSLHQRTMYRATAEVFLPPQSVLGAINGTGDPSGTQSPDRRAQTQADLARVPAVAKDTLSRAGLNRTPRDFLGHSSAAAKTNADLLELSAEDHQPEIAQRLATSYADAFSAYRAQLDTAPYVAAMRQATAQLKALKAAHQTGSQAYQLLVANRAKLATAIALRTKNAIRVQEANSAAQVQPRPVRNGILGFVLGLVIGIALAFLREALDTRVHSSEEVEERLGLPLLARVPEPPRRLRKHDELVMLADPYGAQAETFRLLRTNLDFVRLAHKSARTIMVTSALEQEGKSTTSANLAIAFARAGERVALVDLDLRRPALGTFFDLRGRAGLTQVALGQAKLEDILVPLAFTLPSSKQNGAGPSLNGAANGNGHHIRGGELVVIGSGPLPPNPGEFAGSRAIAHVLEDLGKHFDTVVIDTPPALAVGDPMSLSTNVDAVIVVCRLDVLRRPMLTELRRSLDASPAEKLGFVLTGADGEDGYGYGSAAYYYERSERNDWVGVS